MQVKNSFISLLIDVQNRQKEHRELLRKKKKIRSTATTGPNGQRTTSTHVPGTVSHGVATNLWRVMVTKRDTRPGFSPTPRLCGEPSSSLLKIEASSSVCSLFPPSSAPPSSSLWRDSPMSFTMASVKLLASQEGTNRCPRSFFCWRLSCWPLTFGFPPLDHLFYVCLFTAFIWGDFSSVIIIWSRFLSRCHFLVLNAHHL